MKITFLRDVIGKILLIKNGKHEKTIIIDYDRSFLFRKL